MIILGISAYHGDCSAAILKDGKLIAAVEEERFTRIKHWAGFPVNSIKYCLKEADVDLMDVDYIAIARDTKANYFKKIAYVLITPSSWKKASNRLKVKRRFETIEEIFNKNFGIEVDLLKEKIKYVEHHKAHVSSAYFLSPFKESTLVSIDGFGDFVSAMYGVGVGNELKFFKKVYYPHSIGIFYTMITQFLGFKKYGDEYKVMGLSSYGEPEFLNEMEELIYYKGNGEYELNLKYYRHHKDRIDFNFEEGSPDIGDVFSDEIYKLLGDSRNYNDEINNKHKNIAKSMQVHTENIIFKMLDYAYGKTGIDKLSLAGGVAMNSVANGKIFRRTKFKDVYIPPAAGDAGTSMGAAFYVYNVILNNEDRFHLNNGYLGPGYAEDEIFKTIEEYKHELEKNGVSISYSKTKDELVKRTVEDIEQGLVVGWYQGRMEFGARALGNRSIVVDPRRKDMRDILNSRIKKRESFRPFAPSILLEKTSDWFEESYPVPFMEKVYNIKEEKRALIPAVTHVDGTGRLQTVEESQNPLYYKLIKEFEKKTGVPIVLNTSFNENEPIVNTPQEAINTFLRTKMDTLVMENYILKR